MHDNTFVTQGFRQAAELKGVYTHLKVLLALGGGPDERDTFQFSSVTGLLNRTRAFADKAYWWLVNRGFDGLHLDWRQPGGHCGSPGDKQNFLVLIETLRERFGLRYVLTVGVPYQEEYRHRGYHLPGIADQADFLLATTHGFHDASEKYAQCPSPYTTPNSPTMHDVMRALKYEVPREHRQRLCFSVSLMGHRWTLRSSGSFHAGSAASRAGPAAGDSQARGVLEYPLVCQYLLRDSVDPDGMCSYAVRFRDWVAYEGVQSLPIKLSRMRRDMGTPGLCVAVWDLAFDDFRGDCGNSRSPLLRAIHRALSSRKVFVIPKGAAAGKRP
ncbi:acidic mammalian chitinase-like [Rhipicephalus microplus]|uniref:acidic mammalian chitinase-like n=1 Tax=Rhipicephalus microplus TaxID=6941 RepID=UPI003F6B1DFF